MQKRLEKLRREELNKAREREEHDHEKYIMKEIHVGEND